MAIRLRIYLIFILLSAVSAGAVDQKRSGCRGMILKLLSKPEFGSANQSWVRPETTVAVPGFILRGELIHRSSEFGPVPEVPPGSVFITNDFFVRSGLPIPSSATPWQLHTYRYYPEGETHSRAHRGSGRDYLISVDSEDASNRALSRKGAGTNEVYFGFNGKFDISNFRANGLLPLGEGLLEYIVALNFRNHGVPTVPHLELDLMPKFLQPESMVKGEAKNFAVQVTRLDVNGRESLGQQKPTVAERLKFVASLLFYNSTHGATNPENLTSRAEIMDLGHVTFGYPVISGSRRCTLCPSARGSLYGSTGVGPHDYYFSTEPSGKEIGLRFKLSETEIKGFVDEFVSRATTKKPDISLSKSEREAINFAMADMLAISKPFSSVYPAVLELGTKITGSEYQDYSPSAQEISYSLRFLMQIAGLKANISSDRYKRIVLNTVLLGKDQAVRQSIITLIEMFERALVSGGATRNSVLELYKEFLPSNVIKAEIDSALKNKSYEEALPISRNLIERFTRPRQLNPDHFALAIEHFFARANPSVDQSIALHVASQLAEIKSALNVQTDFEALSTGFYNFTLDEKAQSEVLKGTMSNAVSLVRSELSAKIEKGIFSNEALARGVARSVLLRGDSHSLLTPSVFLGQYEITRKYRSLRAWSEFFEFHSRNGGGSKVLTSLEEWFANPSISVKPKTDLLLSFVGVDAEVFSRLEHRLSENQHREVWYQIDRRSSLKSYLDIAGQTGMRSFVLANATLESFLYASNGFPKPGHSIKYNTSSDGNRVEIELTKPFESARAPVTQLQFALVMGQNPSQFVINKSLVKVVSEKGHVVEVTVDVNRPVESVALDDYQKFIDRFSILSGEQLRLPTEAELRYIIGGGQGSGTAFGQDITQLSHYAWFSDNSKRMTQPIAQLRPNKLGIHDGFGNVMAIATDHWGPVLTQSARDQNGPAHSQARVGLGASWAEDRVAGGFDIEKRFSVSPDELQKWGIFGLWVVRP